MLKIDLPTPCTASFEVEASSSSDSFFSTSRDRPRILAQKALRFRVRTHVLHESSERLVWKNVTGGHIQQYLSHLDESFRIDTPFLSGALFIRFDSSRYSPRYQRSSKLTLLDCDTHTLMESGATYTTPSQVYHCFI